MGAAMREKFKATEREKFKATETRECPAGGTTTSDRQLLEDPGALRLLRAYGQLHDNARHPILNLVESIAADHQRPASRLRLAN